MKRSLIFSAHFDNPDEMTTFKEVFSADRLREFYDASDLTEEDVLKHLGSGDMEKGKMTLLMAVGVASVHATPLSFPPPITPVGTDEIRQKIIGETKSRIAAERADVRIREALAGKPGANTTI